MCKNLIPSKETSFVGWKVVAIEDEGFVSPSTGYLYPKVGDWPPHKMVPVVEQRGPAKYDWADDATFPFSFHYEANMVGKTGVFVRLNDALVLLKEQRIRYKVALLQVQVSGDLMSGVMPGYGPVMVGSTMQVLLALGEVSDD